jgi:hypothetical protein
MSLAVFNGLPTQFAAGGATVTLGLEEGAGALWQSNNGWSPVSAAYAINNQIGITAELTTVVLTVQKTGIYRVSGLVVATTATSGTLPAVTVTYTDADSATAESIALLTSTTTSAAGTQKSAEAYINVRAGGTTTFTGTAYATATYAAKLRAEYLG